MRRLAPFFLLLIPTVALCQDQPPPAGVGAPTTPPAASAPPSAPAPTPAAPTAPSTPTPAAHPSPAAVGSAIIIFYRPKGFVTATFKPSVYVDDNTIGRLGSGENFRVKVPPGPHKIYSNDKSTGTDLNTKDGETYYIRIDMKTGITVRGAVTQVAKEEGAFEVTKTKQVLDVDLTHQPGPAPQPPLAPPGQQPSMGPPLPPPSPQP